MKKQNGSFIIDLIILVITIIGVWGWVWNVVKIAASDTITGLVLLRIIGVFIPPLGSILGFIG